MKTVVIVDDNEQDRRFAETILSTHYATFAFKTLDEAMPVIQREYPAVIIADSIAMRSSNAAQLMEFGGSMSIVFAACSKSESACYTAASEHVLKPYAKEVLLKTVRFASALQQPEYAPCSARQSKHIFVGESEKMQEAIRKIHLYSASDAPVLIVGESGTGKELAAQAIHKASSRRANIFLPVDCASLSSTLIETTLFGVDKGAYTDAVEKKGAFEAAKGGSIFLDEIAELDICLQAKFLRTLETGMGTRVGSVQPQQYDVRIIAATNACLLHDPQRFRPELLHRICTLVITMPALRERKIDITGLAAHFLTQYSPEKFLTSQALAKLMDWHWPGNVRELRNVIQRAAVLSGTADAIADEHVELDPITSMKQGLLFM